MKNKTLIVLTLILLLSVVTKVQAIEGGQEINPKEEKIETLIEIKEGDIWKDLEVSKYNQSDMLIYKVGTHERSANPILISHQYNNEKLLRIVKNGYQERSTTELGLTNENDAYIATKIAIDCVFDNTAIANIDNKYRAKENLNEEQRISANKILEVAKSLVDIGLNGKENYNKSKSVTLIGELDPDKSKPNYVSQLYKVETSQPFYKGYKIKNKSQSPIAYYVANAETGEEQEIFGPEEKEFRIMVPKEYQEDPFELQLDVELIYDIDRTFLGMDGNGRYLILANIEEGYTLGTRLMNHKATLTVNFVDDETGAHILGGKVKIKGQEYEIDRDRKMLLWALPKEQIDIEVLEVPEDYTIKETNIIADVKYRENHVEDIKISHKKGNVKITTLVGQATYEIYDINNNIKGPYTTDTAGNLLIEGINTGRYTIKQIAVKEGYKLAVETEFPIEYGKTFEVIVNNELEPPKEEPEKPTEPPKEETEKPTEPEPPKEEIPEKPAEPELPKEEVPTQITETTKEEKNSIRTTLPRTGNDYFVIKLILINTIIFGHTMYLIKKICNKKTDCQI